MALFLLMFPIIRPKVDMAEAMFDYAPQHVGDLALKVGDKVEVQRKGDDGWWSGTLKGQQGNFPGTSYLPMLRVSPVFFLFLRGTFGVRVSEISGTVHTSSAMYVCYLEMPRVSNSE